MTCIEPRYVEDAISSLCLACNLMVLDWVLKPRLMVTSDHIGPVFVGSLVPQGSQLERKKIENIYEK